MKMILKAYLHDSTDEPNEVDQSNEVEQAELDDPCLNINS